MRRTCANVLRARLATGGATSTTEKRLEELEAELVLLREENARLAAEQVRPANPGRVVERLRAVSAVPDTRESEADDGWEQMAEALVTKELLLSVGIELEQLGGRLRQQLAAGPSAAEPPVFQLGPAGERQQRLHPTDVLHAIPIESRTVSSSSASEGV